MDTYGLFNQPVRRVTELSITENKFNSRGLFSHSRVFDNGKETRLDTPFTPKDMIQRMIDPVYGEERFVNVSRLKADGKHDLATREQYDYTTSVIRRDMVKGIQRSDLYDNRSFGRKMGDDWKFQLGQFKAPWMREELVSSSKQLAADRSLVNEEFNQGRSQGIQLAYKGDQFGFAAMVHDGLQSDNTQWVVEDVEFAASARAEFLAAGDWKQFGDFTSFPGSEFGALIGAAVTYELDEYGTVSGPEEER